MFYVYILIDPRNNTPFYVGKGKGTRWSNHWRWNSKSDNPHKERVIQKILTAGLTPNVVFHAENIEEEDTAYAIEEALIRKIGRVVDGGPLTNICIESGKPPTRSGAENGFYGRHHSDETKAILATNASAQWKGKKQTPEQVRKRLEKFDRDAARARRTEANRTPQMRAVTASRNIEAGIERTTKKVSVKRGQYETVLRMLKEGHPVRSVYRVAGLSYFTVWDINNRISYFDYILGRIARDEQK